MNADKRQNRKRAEKPRQSGRESTRMNANFFRKKSAADLLMNADKNKSVRSKKM